MKRTLSLVFLALVAIALLTSETSKTVASAGYADAIPMDADNFDIRLMTKLLDDATPADFSVEINPRLGTPEIIAPLPGGDSLFEQQRMSRPSALRAFLKQEAALIGVGETQIDELKVTADYTNPNGILSFVHLEQSINGIPVFQGEAKGIFSPDGELVRVVNNLAPRIDESSVSNDFGSAEHAVVRAAADRGIHITTEQIALGKNASQSRLLNFQINGGEAVTAKKFYFTLASGEVRPAWRVMLWAANEAFYLLIDGETGELLWRKRLTEYQSQPATYNVYGSQTGFMRATDSPTPGTPGCSNPTTCGEPPIISRQTFSLIGNESPYTFNNLGWIPDGEERTIGNNVEAGIDRVAPQGIDPDGWAFGGAGRNFVFSYNPSPGDPAPGEAPLPTPQTYPPSAFQQGAITSAFYAANRWHDEAYLLGFNEASRNYQTDNFGRGGVGGDSVSLELQDGSGTNGANFSTPADGGRPRLQLFIWTGTTPSRDGGLDNQILTHEMTHGLSSRLIGNAAGLSSNMSRILGEGWSDFYALAMLSEPDDDQCGIYPIGSYSIQGVIPGSGFAYYSGIRRFPTARRTCVGPNGLPHNPLTFRYLNNDCNSLIGTGGTNPNSAYPRGPLGSGNCDQVLNGGEVWTNMLWEVRGKLIDIHGPAEGNRRSLQYTTDGMKLSPLNPTFLQARDAIVTAAQVSDAQDVCPVWRGFAARGMGESASIQNVGSGSNNTAVTEAFDVPAQCRTTTRADFDGDGRSDICVYRPEEGNWYLNRSTDGFAVYKWGLETDIPAPGDYDGDGKTDIAIFRPTDDGTLPDFYILNSSTSTPTYVSWGTSGDIPAVEDLDGDGRSDLIIFRPSTNRFWILKSSDGSVLHHRPIPGSHPVVGDFDGDGRSDIGVYENGVWLVSASSVNYQSGLISEWGTAGDVPVHADYDGDGIVDIAVYRPSEGMWYIRRSSGGIGYVQFGIATDIPVPADFDGDGRADVAVYRDGIWYISQSTAGVSVFQYGLADDKPIQAAYLSR